MIADETKVMMIMSEVGQPMFAAGYSWARTVVWSLATPFNPDKCHILTIGRIKNIEYTHNYELFGNRLDYVFEEVDIGVTIDDYEC